MVDLSQPLRFRTLILENLWESWKISQKQPMNALALTIESKIGGKRRCGTFWISSGLKSWHYTYR